MPFNGFNPENPGFINVVLFYFGYTQMKYNPLKKVFSVFRKERPEVPEKETVEQEEILVLESKISSLQLDLEEKESRIMNMKQDYARLKKDMEDKSKEAVSENLEKLFYDISRPLSQFYAMKSFVESGKSLDINELFKTIDILLDKLEDFSLMKIGGTDRSTGYNSKFHQAIDGGSYRDGQEVKIKVIGFAFENKILRRAMVTSKEE